MSVIGIDIIAEDMASGAARSAGGSIKSLGNEANITRGHVGALGGAFSNLTQGIMMGVGMEVFTRITASLGGIKDMVLEDQVATEKLNASLKANVAGLGNNSAALKETLTSMQATTRGRISLGFSDDQQTNALGILVAMTHSSTAALRLNRDAMDLARLKGMDLTTASTLMGKVYDGNVSVLKRYGIMLDKNATSTEAIAAIEKMAGGQAEAFAHTAQGATESFQASLDYLGATMGQVFLPILTNLFDFMALSLLPLITDAVAVINGPLLDAMRDAGQMVGRLTGYLKGAVDMMRPLIDQALAPLRDTIKDITTNGDDLTAVLVAVGATVAFFVVPPMLTWAAATIAATWPILAIGAAVAGLVIILDKLGILSEVGYALNHLADYVGPLLAMLQPLTQMFSGLWTDIQSIWMSLKNMATALMQGVDGLGRFDEAINELADNISVLLYDSFYILETAILGLGNTLVDAAYDLGQSVLAIIPGLTATLIVVVRNALNMILTTFEVWLQDFGPYLTGLGDLFLKAISNAGKLIIKALPIIEDAFLQIGYAAVNWVSDSLPGLIESLSIFLQAIFDWVVNIGVPTLGTILGRFVDEFAAWLPTGVQKAIDFLSYAAPKIGAALGLVVDAIVTFIKINLPVLVAHLEAWGQSLIDWIGPRIGPLLEELGKVLVAIGTWVVQTGLPMLNGAFIQMGETLVQWIMDASPKMVAAINDAVIKLGIWIINSGLPLLETKMNDLATAMIAAVMDYLVGSKGKAGLSQQVADWFMNKFLPALPALVLDMAKGLAKFAGDIGGAIVSGIGDALGKLGQAIFDGIKSAINWALSQKIKVGPISIGLSGVSIDMGGINLGGLIPHAAGAWNLPSDQAALVHKGEMIIPASLAESFRNALVGSPGTSAPPIPAGGGASVSVTVQQYFGASSVRSREDIRDIGIETARNARLAGLSLSPTGG